MSATRDDRFSGYRGPGWDIHPGTLSFASLREVLTARAAVRWYFGAVFALVWLMTVTPEILARSTNGWSAALGVTLLIVFALVFLASAPLAWTLPRRLRVLPAAVLLALSFTLFPWIGWNVRATWTYAGVALGMAVLPLATTWLLLLGLGALAVLAGAAMEGWTEDILWIPMVIVSISAMMAAFARNIAAMNELRATRDQMAELAAERERTRVARDIHDILGHSLTVITVKAELAGRLVEADPVRAHREIAEVETLARGALADVRATVAGYRGTSVSGELAAARAALEAAGVTADLPGSTDAVPAERRELAGWAVREGVTNVVRHASASVCRIRLSAHELLIEDDGVGPVGGRGDAGGRDGGGSGLAGLRERVEAAGGRLSVGRSPLGGFALRVHL